MRKGAKRRDWSVSDDRFLVENAGHIPKREICRRLKRSSKSIERRASWHRSHGTPISLRCFSPRTEICPGCGCSRSTMGKHGLCRLCRKREQLANIEARVAELLPLLSQEDRDIYEQTEAERESGVNPRPRPPAIPEDATYYQRMKAREQWEISVELADIRNIEREIKAAQKRKERIEKKVKSMGVCTNSQLGGIKCNE